MYSYLHSVNKSYLISRRLHFDTQAVLQAVLLAYAFSKEKTYGDCVTFTGLI